MFRLWGKIFKENHLIKDIVIENDSSSLSRTKKVFSALEQICYSFDISVPLWLNLTIDDFKKYSKARFYQDNFNEAIDFDYLEIHVIEE